MKYAQGETRMKKQTFLKSLLILLPILAGLLLWNSLPEQLPIHWTSSGEVDDWASKPFAVLGMPALLLVLHWIALMATGADPKRKNHADKVVQLIFWLVPVLSVELSAATYAAALGKDVRIELLAPILMGALFVVIGNYLPKCKQNYTIGIKLPWTLHSEENWNRTHRFAGILWVICGMLIILSGFFSLGYITLAAALLMALTPMLYSYLLYRKGV